MIRCDTLVIFFGFRGLETDDLLLFGRFRRFGKVRVVRQATEFPGRPASPRCPARQAGPDEDSEIRKDNLKGNEIIFCRKL